MQIRMTARHCQLSDHTKEVIERRSDAFLRFLEQIIDAHWTITVDGHRTNAEITAKVHGTQLVSSAEDDDMRTAIDNAADKMEKQLKKHKGRLKAKDPKAISAAKAAAAEAESRSETD